MADPTLIADPAGAPYLVHAGGDGLSRRGRALAWILALALLLLGAGALYSAAATQLTGAQVPRAGTTDGERADAGPGTAGSAAGGTLVYDVTEHGVADAVQAQWDGPTTHLDWKGEGYSTAEATFVGDRIASPGDQVERTLSIANAGPSDGVMSIGLLLDQDVPALAQNPELAQSIELYWDVAGVKGSQTFAALLDQQRAGTPLVAQVQVPRSSTAAVTVGFRMDADVTTDRNLGNDSTALTFQVLAQMQGDTTTYQPPALLPRTGAAVLGAVALAVGLLVAGWLLLVAARRRRRCDDCDRRLGRDDQWNVYHLGAGRRHIRCVECVETLGAPEGAGPATMAGAYGGSR